MNNGKSLQMQVGVVSQVVLRDIPNEDKKARLFKNLRLELFASPCVIYTLGIH